MLSLLLLLSLAVLASCSCSALVLAAGLLGRTLLLREALLLALLLPDSPIEFRGPLDTQRTAHHRVQKR